MDDAKSASPIANAIRPDGGLYNLGHYIAWNPGAETAQLDSEFTAEELRAIADHMDGTDAATFQSRVARWLALLTEGDPTDLAERLHRATEEMAEVAQAGGVAREAWHAIGDRTFDRPEGDLAAEIGGLLVTVAALSALAGIDMERCGEAELRRVNEPAKLAAIRAKRATRHGRGALPGVEPDVEQPRGGEL